MEHPGPRSSPIPPPVTDDAEDVAWALSTAEAMYSRGDPSDALKWLRRAAEAASEGEADTRALELAKATAALASAISPVPPEAAPRIAELDPGLALDARLWAKASEPTVGTALPAASQNTSATAPDGVRTHDLNSGALHPPHAALPAAVNPLIVDSPSVPLPVTPLHEVVAPVPAPPQTRAQAGVRPAQAIRVVVWRTAEGVRVAARGAPTAGDSVEAMLVALDPASDLAAWLSEK